MAVFSKSDGKAGRERSLPLPRSGSAEGAISIIGPGMRIQGNIHTDGTVRVEGAVDGTIRAGKAVVLGQGAEVVGDIITRDAVIGGKVQGTLVADSRLELQSSCVVDGEIRARASHLQLHEGANFNGRIQMIDGDGEAADLPRLPGDPGTAASKQLADEAAAD